MGSPRASGEGLCADGGQGREAWRGQRGPGHPGTLYLSRSWAAGPRPRGSDTFLSGPGGGNKSSSPGSPCSGREAPGRVDGGSRRAVFPPTDSTTAPPRRGSQTHSSDSRSCSSLLRSRKQPSECMLSRTSGSMSSRLGSERICTLRGMGCSGSGSFLPPLWVTGHRHHQSLTSGPARGPSAPPSWGPESCCLPCAQPLYTPASCTCPAQAGPEAPRAGQVARGCRQACAAPPPSLAGPPGHSAGKAGDEGRKSYLHIPNVFLNVL